MKKIPLRRVNGTVRAYALVDDEDFEFINKWKWHVGKYGYATRKIPRISPETVTNIMMHRVIVNPPNGMVTDHKNMKRLDNRRANLRVCTLTQNIWNKTINATNTSGAKGVSWYLTHGKVGRWRASIRANGKVFFLGYFKLKSQAIAARKAATQKYHGEFART